jgi:hypothetical protein
MAGFGKKQQQAGGKQLVQWSKYGSATQRFEVSRI